MGTEQGKACKDPGSGVSCRPGQIGVPSDFVFCPSCSKGSMSTRHSGSAQGFLFSGQQGNRRQSSDGGASGGDKSFGSSSGSLDFPESGGSLDFPGSGGSGSRVPGSLVTSLLQSLPGSLPGSIGQNIKDTIRESLTGRK